MVLIRNSKGQFIDGAYWQGRGGDTRLCGENHWNWRGDTIGYSALHKWARKQFEGPELCWLCGKTGCRINMACINKIYTRYGSTWAKLCVPCHRMIDGHPFSPLRASRRREDVYRLVAQGNTITQIAAKCGVSLRTTNRDLAAIKALGFPEVTSEPV